MSKQRRRQARQKNNPIDIQWFTQDICGDYPEIQTNYNGMFSNYYVQGGPVSATIDYLAGQLGAGNMTWAEASYFFPFFPYLGPPGIDGFPVQGGPWSVNPYYATIFMYDRLQEDELNFASLANIYGGPPEPDVGVSGPVTATTYSSKLEIYAKLLFSYVLVTAHDLNPYTTQYSYSDWLEDFNNFYQNDSMNWVNCGVFDEPDPGDFTDYSVPYPYNEDPCDPAYSALINPETGNYYTGSNFQQITDAFYSIIEQYGQVGATYFFPDLNNDGLITIEDLLDLLILMPITCPYELAPPPKITDLATMAKAPKVEKSNKGKIAKPSTGRTAAKSNVRESLYTSGNEYTLPNGEIYVGAYHIHPTGGAMVGPKHTSAPHAKLTKLPPLKAQIPATSKGGKISKKQTTNQQTTRGSSNGY